MYMLITRHKLQPVGWGGSTCLSDLRYLVDTNRLLRLKETVRGGRVVEMSAHWIQRFYWPTWLWRARTTNHSAGSSGLTFQQLFLFSRSPCCGLCFPEHQGCQVLTRGDLLRPQLERTLCFFVSDFSTFSSPSQDVLYSDWLGSSRFAYLWAQFCPLWDPIWHLIRLKCLKWSNSV